MASDSPDPRPPASPRRTASRIPLAVAAKRAFRRTAKISVLHSPARAGRTALTAPASSRRSLWPVRWQCAFGTFSVLVRSRRLKGLREAVLHGNADPDSRPRSAPTHESTPLVIVLFSGLDPDAESVRLGWERAGRVRIERARRVVSLVEVHGRPAIVVGEVGVEESRGRIGF